MRLFVLCMLVVLVTVIPFSSCCFAEEEGKANDKTIPAELKTAEVRVSPAHGLKGNGFVRWDSSNILRIGQKYHVWYTRVREGLKRNEAHMPNVLQIWMATSEEGRHWTEHGKVLPPSKPGAWHERARHAPHVVPWNGKYYLFFSSISGIHEPYDEETRSREKHIGLAVADRPGGPYEHVHDTPILSPSLDPKAFDHYLIDDPCIIRRDGKFWLYYKGRNSETSQCWLGVANSEKITGPFKRPQAEPVCDANWHTGCVWPHRDGVAGIVDWKCLAYSSDGLHFRLGAKIGGICDAGVFCPDAFDDTQNGRGITWGLSHRGGPNQIFRWDADLRVPEPTLDGPGP